MNKQQILSYLADAIKAVSKNNYNELIKSLDELDDLLMVESMPIITTEKVDLPHPTSSMTEQELRDHIKQYLPLIPHHPDTVRMTDFMIGLSEWKSDWSPGQRQGVINALARCYMTFSNRR